MTGQGVDTSAGLNGGQQDYRGEKLADNIAHFVRMLRRVGLKIGPATVLDCVAAGTSVDLGSQTEFYHALASCVVKRPEDRQLSNWAVSPLTRQQLIPLWAYC